MPRYFLEHFGKQEIVELENERHIQGQILWSEKKDGPLPGGIIVGAMDLVDSVLVLNSAKKTQLDNEIAQKEAEKVQKENKKKAKENLVFKLKNEDLKLNEVNQLLRELF